MPALGVPKKIPDYMREKASFMRYNPLVIEPSASHGLRAHYPDLFDLDDIKIFMQPSGDRKEDTEGDRLFKNRAIRYMIWLYSKDSILNTKPQEALKDRKYKALGLAGFQPQKSNKKYPPRVIHDLVELKSLKFLRAVLAYLREKNKNELWIEIVATEEQHFEAIRLRMTPALKGNEGLKQAEFKKKLQIICKELMIDIQQYWDEFWEDNLDMKALAQDEVYLSIEDRARINAGE